MSDETPAHPKPEDLMPAKPADQTEPAKVIPFEAKVERFTAAHVMRKHFGVSQADGCEALLLLYKDKSTQQLRIGVSEDMLPSSLAVYSHVIDNMAKQFLGLVPVPAVRPAPKNA